MNNDPKSNLIENVAVEFAAAFYENARMIGLSCKPYKNQRDYIKKNFEKFIPKAIEQLTDMLGMSNYSDHVKKEIYEALMERANWTPTINGTPITDPKLFH